MLSFSDASETLNACRALFLQRLSGLVGESGVVSNAAIQAIQHGAGAYFDDVLACSRRGSFEEEVDGLTSSRLTLVGDDDLELEIRLDNLSAHLFQTTGVDLWKIHLRFVALLKRPDLSKTSNPVGPNAIARGLEEMFAAAGVSTLDKKLDLLDRIKAKLEESLPPLYAEIDNFLAEQGVEAAPSVIVGQAVSAHKATASNTPGGESNLLALQQVLMSRLPGFIEPASGNNGNGNAGAVASLLSKAMLERLIFKLDELDRLVGPAPTFSSSAPHHLEALIPGLFVGTEAPPTEKPKAITSAEIGLPAMAPEGLAIDTLAMIFATVFDHPALPDAFKAVISSLQITLLKLAMQDATFFSDTAHPGRLLFDRMGVAMHGLPLDVSIQHPVCKQLFKIAGELRSHFSGDKVTLIAALDRVDALIDERNASMSVAAESYVRILKDTDRREQLAFKSRAVVNEMLQQSMAEPIREFLENTWCQVLQRVLAEHGPESSQWEAHKTVIDDLLWTFQPKHVAEDRKFLAKRLPEILKLLKSGMERIGMPAEAQAAFLDVSFALQTQALRATPVAPVIDCPKSEWVESIPAKKLPQGGGEVVLGELRDGALLLHTVDFASSYPVAGSMLPCQPGDWLEAKLIDAEPGIARLCWFMPGSKWALLFNLDLELAVAIHTAILQKQFDDGVARVCSSVSLFDDVAASALQRSAGG